jgi:PAS domain S-box-containing protein
VETKMAQSPENNPNPILNVDCQALLDENHALKAEVQKLRARLEEPEELQRAIREGDVDALVMPVSTEDLMIFTLNSADSAYRMLLETANEDMVIVDAEFKITYAGKRLLDKTGYRQEEVIDRSWLDFVDEESKAVAELHMEKRRQDIAESYEFKLISKNSSPYWALISVKPLFDKMGKFKGAMAMLTDITELKNAQEERERLLDQIQQEKERLSALINSVTDEVVCRLTEKL